MSQFRIRGIDYADENLQHGLGIGSGRGRPKGSRNGQIMPGAAYMQKYKIVGEKAEGTTNLPGAQNTTRRLAGPVNPNLQRDYRRAVNQPQTTQRRTGAGSTVQQQLGNARMVRSNSNQRGTLATQTGGRRTSTPATTVAKGKNAVDTIMNKGTTATSANNQATGNQQEINDWPWSARRVNAAGGLESREGRQIVYDNPTLNEDYKKHIAKRYGDSDGKSYPKKYEKPEEKTAQTANTGKEQSAEREFVNDILGNVPDSTNSRRLNLIQPVGSAGRTPSNSGNDGQTTGDNQPARTNQTDDRQTTITPDETPSSETTPSEQQPAGNTPSEQTANNAQQEPAQPAEQHQETPEQKSFWDNVGGWFAQAGKDIGDTVVGALNTAGSAISDAAVWVGDRLKEGGEWALASMGDVGEWIGDRASDLNTWWNGRGDVEVLDRGRWRQGHDGGAREAVGNFFNDAGQRIGNAAGDVGRAVGGAANTAGQWIGNAAGDVGRAVGGAANSAGQWIGNAAGDVGRTVGNAANATGQWIGNAAGDVGRAVGGAVNDAGQWIGNAAGDVGRAANAAGQWIGNAAGDVGRAVGDAAGHVGAWAGQRAQDVSNFVNGVQPGTPAAAPYLDLGTGQWVYPASTPSLGERIGNAAGNVGQWVGDTATNAWNGAAGAANDAGQAVDRWWNGDNSSSRSPLATPLVSNPVSEWFNSNVINPVFGGILPNSNANTNNGGARGWINNNIVAPVSNAANGVGNFVRDTANNVGQGASNLASNVGQTVTNTYNQVTGNTMENADNATARALNAGIPADYVGQLRDQLTLGLINPSQYVQQINNLLDNPNMTDPDRR